MTIHDWSLRWQVPQQAMQELMTMDVPYQTSFDTTEASTQQKLRLSSATIGANLWRNNNGAGVNDRGDFMRWGLGNDSKRVNDAFKSSDLIGITPIMITQQHIGRVFGIFTAVEVKKASWKGVQNDREKAQWRYLQLVLNKGGFATFARSVEDYKKCIHATG